MDVEVPYLSGYLIVPTQSGFPLHRISKKKSCQKFCLLFKSSRYGIERLEICESKEDKNPKIVTLENCVKITQEPCPANIIYIVKKTGTLTLNALNRDSLKEWVTALQTVAFRSKSDLILTQSAIEEDNDLYCSSYGDGLFIVTLIPSEASIRCNIMPKVYMLHLTDTELQLKSTNDLSDIISNWPYRFIRKYGYRNGKFTFEAGRKCFTGEGIFTLDHTNPQEVFRCMSSKMKSMKKMITCDGIKVDSCENQLNAAAAMEAGSRSPLPPYLSNQNSTEFEINSTQSSFSIRNLMPMCETTNNSATPKILPNKPPRKINTIDKSNLHSSQLVSLTKQLQNDIPVKFSSVDAVSITSSDPNKAVGSSVILKPTSPDEFQNCQEIETFAFPKLPARNDLHCERDYECIETITDAWKTLGINEVKHNEQFNLTDLNNIIWDRSNSKNISSPKIIDIDIGECSKSQLNKINSDLAYDRLDFLKANHKTSNGYKTIVAVSPLTSKNIVYKSTQNEYELINPPEKCSIRKNDENCLGYGVLRQTQILSHLEKECKNTQKYSTINAENNSASSNDFFLDENKSDDLKYSIVSKAKQI
ncbi:docking protein homolog isoform 1-T2 [Cochliomyia hominivorax]